MTGHALVRELRLAYVSGPVVDDLSSRLRISRPSDAAMFFTNLIGREPVEVFAVLLLDTQRRSIGAVVLSRGSIDTTVVHPREVFVTALLGHASSLITAHNHPSGDTTPSPDDIELWRRLGEAGKILGIEVADHLIIGHGGRYFSALEGGIR